MALQVGVFLEAPLGAPELHVQFLHPTLDPFLLSLLPLEALLHLGHLQFLLSLVGRLQFGQLLPELLLHRRLDVGLLLFLADTLLLGLEFRLGDDALQNGVRESVGFVVALPLDAFLFLEEFFRGALPKIFQRAPLAHELELHLLGLRLELPQRGILLLGLLGPPLQHPGHDLVRESPGLLLVLLLQPPFLGEIPFLLELLFGHFFHEPFLLLGLLLVPFDPL
mmetsp:Transcript_44110/g.134320  ORF Transcript_44110/g.134320 Transcript_44110/m.134320 type:complete len:223 (-) Transcript_44110:1135-1803(-)